MLLSSRSPSPNTSVGLMTAQGNNPKPLIIPSSYPLPPKVGGLDSVEALAKEKRMILLTPRVPGTQGV